MKKKNPNDTTFRNINALKKRVKRLEDLERARARRKLLLQGRKRA